MNALLNEAFAFLLFVRPLTPSLLPGLEVEWVREAMVGGDRWLEEGEEGEEEETLRMEDLITLQPMEIRTFILKTKVEYNYLNVFLVTVFFATHLKCPAFCGMAVIWESGH